MTLPASVAPPAFRLLVALLLVAFCGGACAADSAELAQLRERVQEGANLDDARKSELLALLQDAQADSAAAAKLTEEARQLRVDAAAASSESRRLERDLARAGGEDYETRVQEIEALLTLEALEGRLQALYGQLEPLRREQQLVLAALSALGSESSGNSTARLQESIAELEQQLGASEAEPSLETRAQRERRVASLALRRAELELAQIRQQTASARRGVLELRQRALRQRIGELEQLVRQTQARLGERSEAELAALAESLAMQQLELIDAPLALSLEAALNIGLGVEFSEANRRLAALRVETADLAAERERLERALRDTTSRLALGAVSEAVGAVLLRERQRLPLPENLRRRTDALAQEVVQAKLRLFDLTDAQSQLESVRSSVLKALQEDASVDAVAAAWAEQLDGVLQARADLLRRLETTLRRLIERLEQAEVNLERQLADSLQLKAVLDRQLFWIPSHRSVDVQWLRAQGEGWGDLLKPSRLGNSLSLTVERLRSRPLLALGAVLLVTLLFVLQRRAKRALPELAQPIRRIREDKYLHTWQALAWTLAAALPWAAVAWLAGQLLQSAGEPGKYTHSQGTALAGLVGSIALFTFVRWLLIEKGLAHAHFRWTRARREALSTALPWAVALLLPAQFFSTLAFIRGQDLAIDTAGRALLMVFALVGGGLFWWLLAPARLWSPRGGVIEPVRLRQFIRIALAALLLLIVVLTLQGYVFTAGVLVRCLWETGGALLLVALVHGLLGRWFLLGERKLALRRAEARREAAATGGEALSDGELPPESEAEELDIQSIGAQTQRLVRAVAATLLVLLLFWVWADILPALQRLDELALWSFSDTNAEGEAITAFVSLRAALLGLGMLVLTTIAARNLPGLIEIGLLSRINIDAPSRYAITSLARYAIVIIGVVAGLGYLGLRWSQLQWMAAALTVGLGFGLQEIFANFVSGLILLFEKPFRVGDIITIGEFTGRVTRIRTRATTILDFDNKEVVIPNKSFITDRLTNWTLSDTLTRVIVRVGVAYGSDPVLVHRLLQKAAADCSYVAAEPAPRSWFLAFGASSLDFELRVFVPSIDQRLLAQNDLHGRIVGLFHSNDIEIAFPQMDLHVRDLPRPQPGGETLAAPDS